MDYKQTWSNLSDEDDIFAQQCGDDEQCHDWLEAREEGYTGSLQQFKASGQGSGFDWGGAVTTGLDIIRNLTGKKGNGGANYQPQPQQSKGIAWYWWAIGAVAVAGIGFAIYKSRQNN